MKLTLTILAFLFSSATFSQQNAFTDSMSVEICKTFTEETDFPDSLRLSYAFYKHYDAFTSRFDSVESERMFTIIYIQMQKTCPGFLKLLEKLNPTSSGWQLVDEEPASTASEKECREFFSQKKLRYVETSGDTTRLVLSDKFWIDQFSNGTYSKLSLNKNSACDFTISFLESSNETRLALSKKGDKYRYKIISKEDSYYKMYMEVPESNIKCIFRIHFE